MIKNPIIFFQIDQQLNTNIFSLNIFLFNVSPVVQVIYDHMPFALLLQKVTMLTRFLIFFYIYIFYVTVFIFLQEIYQYPPLQFPGLISRLK